MDDSLIKLVSTEKELKDAMEVRKKVFQEEQGIDEKLDFDGQDKDADHMIVYIDNQPIGTARVRYLDEKREKAKVERVAVLKEYRKLGIGKLIMEYLHDHIDEKGVKEIMLESQEHARGFYENLGYKQEGEVFEEVGIPHVKMVKKLEKNTENDLDVEAINNF
jgi:predicted GNAT family N-acyltransferase